MIEFPEEDPRKIAMQKALDLLARREHSQKELKQKLMKRDFSAELIDDVLSEIAEQGWQSDLRFAEDYLSARKRDLYGPERIRMELSERGVSDDIIDSLLNVHDDEWFELARQLKLKKFGEAIPEEYAEKAKQMRFLQYRGFTLDQINQSIDH